MNTPRLFARPHFEARGWNSELVLRYGAATLVTLIALAAAQLVLPTKFMLILGAVTLLGAPVSLWMRMRGMRIAGWNVPRPLWNALTVVASCAASAFFLRAPLLNLWDAVQGGLNDAAILRIGATEPMLLLVQLFLIFAAFRSFSPISDKDATLATVPSFSVLLLLVPVYPNIEVVCYFIVWTLVATMLFALDHRSEIHGQVMATVPAPAPGEDVKLAARSLAGVLTISLVAAVALSGLLTARDPREGSSSDSAISMLAMRLTRLSLQSEEASINNGPQRQIDFSSGTSLPMRAELWRATDVMTLDGRALNPTYWRLFTLSSYNGSIWSQNNSDARSVESAPLTRAQWPRLQNAANGDFGGRIYDGAGFGVELRRENRISTNERTPPRPQTNAASQPTFGFGNGSFPRIGFALSKAQPKLQNSFGSPRATVQYRLEAARTALGFVPLLPAPRSLRLLNKEQNSLRVRADGGVDVSVIESRQIFRVISDVPAMPEYGFKGEGPPFKKVTLASNNRVPTLSAAERASNLALPAQLPPRVSQLAREATKNAPSDASNYARAQMLARATQQGAIYTLRPPQIPAGRDAADFFLFESRRGYCTYFAGALTVLCRAQGIPARVVSGFVAPERTGEGQSLIRDANAHAWTEVWIENWGWALVDATPSDDRGDNAPTLLENWGDWAASSFDNLARWSLARWPVLLSYAVLLLLALVVWRFRDAILRRLGRAPVETVETKRRSIAAEYARATRLMARRFRPRQSWETPDEWLQAARVAVPHLPFEPLQTLTALYVRAHFSPLDLNDNAVQDARRARTRVVWPKKRARK